jgi:hypothetical protein
VHLGSHILWIYYGQLDVHDVYFTAGTGYLYLDSGSMVLSACQLEGFSGSQWCPRFLAYQRPRRFGNCLLERLVGAYKEVLANDA